MDNAHQIAAGLTPDESKAMRGFFFSDATGESLLAMGMFSDRAGWPMTVLGGQVQRALFGMESRRG